MCVISLSHLALLSYIIFILLRLALVIWVTVNKIKVIKNIIIFHTCNVVMYSPMEVSGSTVKGIENDIFEA